MRRIITFFVLCCLVVSDFAGCSGMQGEQLSGLLNDLCDTRSDKQKDYDRSVQDRKMSPQAIQNAKTAKSIFQQPGIKTVSLQSLANATPVLFPGSYDPSNAATSKMYKKRLDAVKKKYAGKKKLSFSNQFEVFDALAPYIKYVEAVDRATAEASTTIRVPPHSKVVLPLRGYCLDLGIPAPRIGEKHQLVKSDTLITPDLKPLFDALLVYSPNNPGDSDTIQAILWKIRNFRFCDNLKSTSLSPDEKRVITAATPDGLNILNNFVANNQSKCYMAEQKKQITNMLGNMFRNIGSSLPVPGANGNPLNISSSADVQKLLYAMNKMPVEGGNTPPQENSEYTLLDPSGIAAKTYSPNGGEKDITTEIVNATDNTYNFCPSIVTGQSTSPVQREALSLLNPNNSIGPGSNFHYALQQILGMANALKMQPGVLGNNLLNKFVKVESKRLWKTIPAMGAFIGTSQIIFDKDFFTQHPLDTLGKISSVLSIMGYITLLGGPELWPVSAACDVGSFLADYMSGYLQVEKIPPPDSATMQQAYQTNTQLNPDDEKYFKQKFGTTLENAVKGGLNDVVSEAYTAGRISESQKAQLSSKVALLNATRFVK